MLSMERRKRKAIASLLDNSHLQRLPKFGAKLSHLVGSQTASRTNIEESYPGPDNRRCSRLDFSAEDLGGSGLNIDLRSLEAFRDADNSWFGHDPAAQGAGGKQGQANNKSSTPIADQFSRAEKGEKGNIAALQVDKASVPRPRARPELPGSPNGRIGRQALIAPKSNETASTECIPKSASGRSGSVLERQRGVRPRLSKEKLDPSIEPIRIKLATTSQPADPQTSRSREPTREIHAGRTSQQASRFSYQSRFASDGTGDTPGTVTRGPKLSGVSVKTHIRRCSQHHNQIADSSENASKRQSMPASIPGSLAGRSTLVATGRDPTLHTTSKPAGLPGDLRLTGSSSVARPSEHPRHSWSAASPPSSASIPVPGHDVRRHASARVSNGKRLAWIKELEERKQSNLGLNRELPVLRKMEGSVADKLARFERLAQQPDDVPALQRVTRTRSDSISSQRSYLTSAGSRPASWYQSGSTIATTARTSTDSHRPPSVLLNYDESFREKMQVVAGKYNKRDQDEDQDQDQDRDQDRESEDSQTLKWQTQSGDPNEGKSGHNTNQSHKAEAAKGLNAPDDIQTTIPSSGLDCVGQLKSPETPCLAPE